MTATVVDDFDRRWADWQEKGRRRNIVLQRRMLWLVWPIGTSLLAAVVWALR